MSFLARLKRFRRAHHGLAYVLAAVVVLMAVVGIAAGQLLPMVERHPDRIAGWLGDRAGRKVSFDTVDTRWTRRGPLLELGNLRIGSGSEQVRIGDAEVLVSQYSGLLPGRSFTELRVRGLDITVERDDTGRWSVRGMPGQAQTGDPFESLERLGELQLVGARLRVLAPAWGIDASIPQAHLRLQVDGDTVRAGLRAWMRTGAAPLEGVLDFDRVEGDGRAWISLADADLAHWSPLLRIAGVQATGGSGRAAAWLRLQSRRVVRVAGDIALRDVVLAGTQSMPGQPAPATALPRVTGRLRLEHRGSQWRLDVPALAFGEGPQAPRVEGLSATRGPDAALAATRIDMAPLAAVAGLSDWLQPGIRRWLQASRPTGALRDVRFARSGDNGLRVSAMLLEAGFQPAGTAPGLRRVSGRIDGDDAGVRFRPDPSSTLLFDWPRQYAAPHPLQLDGDILGWREGAGWRVGTHALRIEGDGYGARVRGGLWFQGDGSRPWIDLAADIDTTQVAVARKFWMRNLMPAAAIRWLENGLQGGRVADARAVVSGDLDDWPFDDRDGLFHASARIEAGVVKFQQDWPEARQFEGRVDFIADGFSFQGERASIAGVGIGAFDAGIERFGDALLTVNAKAQADAARLLALLRQSPLRKSHGDTLDQLEASGSAEVDFALRQPLRGGGARGSVAGTVELDQARLVAKAWKLDFSNVSGQARYSDDGFEAEALAVEHARRPGTMSLRAGDPFVRDAANAFEGELRATLAAGSLLDHAPELSWLRDRVAGESPWTVAVTLPKGKTAAAPPSRLRLRSDLAGTALRLPEPLDKPAGTRLPTTIEVALPLDQGDVAIAFGRRMALRARSANGRTGVRVALGTDRIPQQAPAEGIVASGQAQRLDAIGWAGVASGGGGAAEAGESGDGGPSLRDVDIGVADLRLVGASFPNARLRAVPVQGGIAVRVEGPALQGALMLPRGGGGAIAGRFERLHWRAAPAGRDAGRPGAGGTATIGAASDSPDPAGIPALNLAVDDFRFGEARLGTAGLRTRPTADGMRIEQLQTRAPRQSIDVSGSWTGRGAAARTRLDMQVRSQDFGTLLAGLGLGSQVDEGEGEVGLKAQWPGSPADFGLGTLDGNLEVNLRDGQLVQIEPGAGRMLGLFSIMQLPRRLSFDFSDFFEKGFAFDTIRGEVRLQQGSARSDDMVIDGPAAEIHLRGAADLRAQTYDQTIDVFPKAGSLLTVAGALAGGPVGAAIGAAANAVLNKPIGQLAARRYRVTGPWKDPKVETVRDAGAAAAARTEAGGGDRR